jgi:hypothetical protein
MVQTVDFILGKVSPSASWPNQALYLTGAACRLFRVHR